MPHTHPALVLGAALLLLSTATAPAHTETTPANATVVADISGVSPGSAVPNFRLNDQAGASRELYYESTAKATVLVFTSRTSPRALQTAAALRSLRARFSTADVAVWQIDSNAGTSRAAVAADQVLYNNPNPVLLDDRQLVATELGVTRENETLVIGPGPFWLLAYRGPLDDADPLSTAAPSQNYASDAVAAMLAGRQPANPRVDLASTAPRLDLGPPAAMDYVSDVAPIVQRRCVSCHSTGNIAPHVYAKYDDLAARAGQIRADILAQQMSPWHADSRYNVFANSIALSPGEAATLVAWARAGAPRGSGVDPLPAAHAAAATTADWPLGTPDLVLTIPKQDIPARGTIDYRYITINVPVANDTWLKGAVVRPGNRKVVHHALVFEGTLLDVLLNAGGLGGFFSGYVPGLQPAFFPAGTGKLVRKGGALTFQMHYTTAGQAETDETQIGLYFASSAPDQELLTKAAATTSISIPPGAREYEREATFTPSTTKDVLLYELNPHMHYRGKRAKFEAVYPNGTTEVLLNVPRYDFDWQSQYRLAEPKRLPAGTSIRFSGAFDNSALNRDNPDATATVKFGEQTSDEMFIGYINYAELPSRASAAAPVYAEAGVVRALVGEPLSVAATASGASAYRARGLPAGLSIDGTSGIITGTPTSAGRFQATITADSASGSTATTIDFTVASAGAPVFTIQPRSIRVRAGEPATFAAGVSASPAASYSWYFRGAPVKNANTASLTIAAASAAEVGDYYCVATNAAGSTTSLTATLSLDFTGLVNLSARANVGTGANVVIPGVTVRGDKPKTLLIRAVGPTLGSFGVSGALANPVLSIFDAASQKIVVNDNWNEIADRNALVAAMEAQGAFALPDGSRDAAALVTLAPGSYTVQVAGLGTGTAAQGVAIVEVYEADASPSTLVNLSCRARVGTGADVLIAGFVVRGTSPRKLLIRGIGPALAAFGVSGTLADPKLEIFRQGTTAPLATNEDWSASLAGTFASVGAFSLPAGSKDAALVVTLDPGSYTAQVSGSGGGTGLALVEVYEIP